MHDRRVVRGNTYSTVVVTQVANRAQVSTAHLRFVLITFHINLPIVMKFYPKCNLKTIHCYSRELQSRALVPLSGEVKDLWAEALLGCKHTGDLSQGGEGGCQVQSRKLNWGFLNGA